MTTRTDNFATPMKVVLQTTEGEHVATASILPFQLNPSVMIWGSRIFLETELQTKAVTVKGDEIVQHGLVPIYREGYPWTVLHTDECGDTFPTVEG